MTTDHTLAQKITLWTLAGLAAHQIATIPSAEAAPTPPTNPQAGPGVECAWFASDSRPMTTTLFIDPARMSIVMERHGGTQQPPSATGCDTAEDYLDAKAADIRKHFKHITNFVLAAERDLSNLDPGIHIPIDVEDLHRKRQEIDTVDRRKFRFESVDGYVRTGAEALQTSFDTIEASGWHLSPETKQNLEDSRTQMVRDNLALNLALIQITQQNRADRDFTNEKQEHLHDIWQNAAEQNTPQNIRKDKLIDINYQWFEQRTYRAPSLPQPSRTLK